MYKVSILVPVYKVDRFIERCARSLFEQTYSNIEFVFVNDCTPDESVEILEQVMNDYPDRASSVKIINHDTNRGVAAARNTLLDNATGDFVSWVDSDDWLEDNAVELLVNRQVETNADIVSGNIFLHYEDRKEPLVEEKHKDKEKMLLLQLKDTWNMNTFIWGRLFRRLLFEDYHIRCKEGANYAEDRYQVVRLFYFAKSFAAIDAFVYNYEKRNGISITVQQKENMSVYLRNQYQHLQNWIGIRDFFSDKEKPYYQLAVSNTSRLLKMNLDWTLKYKSKEEFFGIVGLIDENEDCMRAMRWKKKGIKGAFLHNYGYMKMMNVVKRSVRFVKKRLLLDDKK